MKIASAFIQCFICVQLYACNSNTEVKLASTSNISANKDTMRLKIIVGPNIFTATLYNNATIAAFTAKLPMTIKMEELNGNEKYYTLSDNMPYKASNPGTIHEGDLMLYGSKTLVLFYKTFSTSYNYTRLGRIDDSTGLAVALGSGNVAVTFEVE